MREAGAKAFEYERELRTVYDQHEREMRRQVEDATAANLARQAIEYERRLDDLNHSHDRAVETQKHTVSRELYDVQHDDLRVKVDMLVTQVGVWKWIALFLGLPGLLALAGVVSAGHL